MIRPVLLSPHLTFAEFTTTQHREWLRENADPPDGVVANGFRFAMDIFEPARNLVGPMHVTSGYRCPELNAAIGGSPTSAHVLGYAADLVPLEMTMEDAFMRVLNSAIPYDQIIAELWDTGGGWIHLGASLKPRRQALMKFEGSDFEAWDITDPRLQRP